MQIINNYINDFGTLKLDVKKNQPLEQAVYNALKRAIHSGYLMQGERLVEQELAEQLNVSRTPLREALKKLAYEKWVDMIPNKGASVAKLSPSRAEEIYSIAAILEGGAAYRAVKYMEKDDIDKLKKYLSLMEEAVLQNDYEKWLDLNNKFHGVFVYKCNLPALVELIKEKVDRIPYSWHLITLRPNPLKEYMEAHEKIIEAFINKDAELVRSVVENHILRSFDVLSDHFNNKPSS